MGLLDQFGKGASGGTISKPGLSKAGKRGGIIRKSIAGAVGIVVVIVCVLAVEAITGLHPGSQSSPSDIGENQQNCTSLDLSFAAELFKELPPSNSGVNSEHDKKICLDVVGRYYGSRTTGERDAFCSDYGAFTPKKSDAAKQFFIDTIDKSTPENRYNWCVEDRESIFPGKTLAFAESACSQLKTDWPTLRENITDWPTLLKTIVESPAVVQ